MNPFIYPKGRHLRKQMPGIQSRYQKYKVFLREEFDRRCVYCRMPDAGGKEGFGVDHYRPKKLFPELITTYSNLYYCCNPCNSRKGDHWPTDPKSKNTVIPNPCDSSMAAHLRYRNALVEAKTPSGSFTRDLLDLNAPDVIKRRDLMINLIEICQSTKTEFRALKAAISRQAAKGNVSASATDPEFANLQNKINELDRAIQQLLGTE